MNSQEYSKSVLDQLVRKVEKFDTPPIKELHQRNASQTMREIVLQRLATASQPIEKQKNSRYGWNLGSILIRTARVSGGFWSNIPKSQIINLKQELAGIPAALLFCFFEVGLGTLHAWAVPADIALDALETIPDNKSGMKTIYIETDEHRFKYSEYSPDLTPFYRVIELSGSEHESLIASIKQDQAAKEIGEEKIDSVAEESEDPVVDEETYSQATVDFVLSLPAHTKDKEWHRKNHESYNQILRIPTIALTEKLRSRFIAGLDPKVAECTHNLSVLRKNDYGRGEFHDHFWSAFFDPVSGSKTRSSQLFFALKGNEKLFYYGFAFGNYCEQYINNLHQAITTDTEQVIDYLSNAPEDVWVSYHPGHEMPLEPIAHLVSRLRQNARIEPLTGTEPIRILRKFPLAELPLRASGIDQEIGAFFAWAWPFFDASRTGRWSIKRSTKPLHSDEDLPVDEQAASSIDDLAEISSMSVEKLLQIEETLLTKHQLVFIGPPGTSKTYLAELFARYFVRENSAHPQGSFKTVFMHTNWGYEDFFEGIRPRSIAGKLEFELRTGFFLSWIKALEGSSANARHVLIIDEINRCDTAAVLGELLQLFEYRGRKIQLLSGTEFVLPSNIYFIGTMNSADRSIGRIDLALHRRFMWMDLNPDYKVLEKWLNKPGNNPAQFSARRLENCNRLLENHGVSKDQQIGHALFMPQTLGKDGVDSKDIPLIRQALRRIVLFSIVPYVKELSLMHLGRVDLKLIEQIQEILLENSQSVDLGD
jgi:MoxR-like ATPase